MDRDERRPYEERVVLDTHDVMELSNDLGQVVHKCLSRGVPLPGSVERLFRRIAEARMEIES
jgi:hypothetical protein